VTASSASASASSSPQPAAPPVVVITGPTAAGKSALALELAERFGGEIVNADSMQVYRYMDIGTAKPGPAERARVPHHLLDAVTPDVPYDAGRYLRDARAAAAQVHGRGAPVLLVGGTGLYIRAFLHGLVSEGGAADPALRARLEAEHARAVAGGDPGRLHRRLGELDPDSAARIHPHDLRRVVRALEILERTGRLLQEVRDLYDRGYGPELRPLQSIGYRHMAPVAAGSDTLANALRAMQRDTRRFARRQRTWFRGVPEAQWHHPGDLPGVAKAVEEFLRRG